MKRSLFTILALIVLFGGCSRQIEKVTDADKLPAAPQAPTDLSLRVGDQMLALTWTADATGSVGLYLIYRSDSTAANFVLRDSTESNSYDDMSVQNNVRYFYRISAVSESGVEGEKSGSIAGIPGLFSIRIAGDSEYTNTRNVSVSVVYATGTTHIMMSNSSSFLTSKWQNVAETVSWELPDTDGIHSVYAKFKMADGHESIDLVNDQIALDRVALIEDLTSDDGGEILTAGDVIHFRMLTGETGGSSSIQLPTVGNLKLFDDGTSGDPISDDGTYELDYTIPPEVEFENGTVTGEFRDIASNAAPSFTIDHTITVRNIPLPVVLYVTNVTEGRVELAWTESGAGDFASYRLYRSDAEPVTESSHLVTEIGSRTTVSATDSEVDPSTSYFYMMVVTDETGLTSNSNTVSATTPANAAPEPVVAVFEKTDSTSFKLTWTRNDDDDFESYRIFRSTTSDVSNSPEYLYAIINSQSSTSYSGDDEGESYYYIIVVYDRFGLHSESSNTVPYTGP